ncbi:MlaE family ABC transporter permease [Campylobacter pinnipediorum]|uniref:MlaE family ABC transporter permease n=1 Tax=Campylobacter pinnipediorum TaxID=1965231 RepID=UPI00214C4A8E|nr:ABC transporter permease [Campylobacter pinnipediorum]
MNIKQNVKIQANADFVTIYLNGDLTYKNAKELNVFLLGIKKYKNIQIDFSNLNSIDYSVAILLDIFLSKYNNVKFINQNDNIVKIFDFVRQQESHSEHKQYSKGLNLIQTIGKKVLVVVDSMLCFCSFFGEFLVKSLCSFYNPKNFRLKELSNYIKDGGINAIFIVLLTSFLIGIVLAYLGSAMLANFGASIFIVDIMGILTLREVAPLIATIVIAGRSSSSFAAQIGVMKITEEIDAMKTMGLDPVVVLVFPRVMAMVLSVPLVIFLADGVSILGQMLVSKNILDIDFSEYISRFKDSVDLKHFWVGMIKAPFFGAMIAIIGCLRGFEVNQNAQSLGEKTTTSVVNAIFCVVALDSVFAIFFMWYGI